MNEDLLREEYLKLEKKLYKEPGGKEFIEEYRALADSGDLPGLEFKLKEFAKHKQAIISTQQNDDALRKAKQEVSTLNAPYQEQLKGNTVKSRFIGLLLQLNGGLE